MMEIEMRRFLWVATVVASLVIVVACGADENEGPDFVVEEVPGGTVGYTEIEGGQAALGTQAALGESITLNAGLMKGPVGEPPLQGSAVVTFSSLGTASDIGNAARALAGGASAAFFDSREGHYLVVYYTVKNDTEGGLQPSTHVNGSFMLVDDQGRAWSPANYYSHGFRSALRGGIRCRYRGHEEIRGARRHRGDGNRIRRSQRHQRGQAPL